METLPDPIEEPSGLYAVKQESPMVERTEMGPVTASVSEEDISSSVGLAVKDCVKQESNSSMDKGVYTI